MSTESDKNKLVIFERKILHRIFGSERNDEGGYEIRSKRELNTLFNEPNIAAALKSQRIRWVRHVWRAEDSLILASTKWKPNKSRSRGRPRQRWDEDRVKKYLRMLGGMNGEELAQRNTEGDSGSGNRSKWPRVTKKKKHKTV